MLLIDVTTGRDVSYSYIHPETFNSLHLSSNKIVLHYGCFTKELKVAFDDSLIPGTIVVPSTLSESITIPSVPFEAYAHGNHVHIGPVIGLLTTPQFFQTPTIFENRLVNYDSLNGLFYIFTLEGINQKTMTIEGLYYEPQSLSFQKGIFPYPNTIYKRAQLPKKYYNHFVQYLGNTIFNTPYFLNKFTFHSTLSKHPLLQKHLPHTIKYRDFSDLQKMLALFRTVYLKPTNCSRGRGILRVKKYKKEFRVTNQNCETFVFKSIQPFRQFLKAIITRRYIIQQEILSTYNGDKIDIRAYFQKDLTKSWQFTGIEARVGKKNSIITNSANRQFLLPGLKVFSEVFLMNVEQTNHKLDEITNLGILALKKLETKTTHLGESAIDLIIDKKSHKIYLLEAQTNFAGEKLLERPIEEQGILLDILPAPLFYAKSLAGFF